MWYLLCKKKDGSFIFFLLVVSNAVRKEEKNWTACVALSIESDAVLYQKKK